ncbi:sodium transporter, putative [Entamoeba dispar SAW760]|uniref:Sodium transporter, putative n=1 Tax=Entamoeba dispar (strain ATCC PRA-260 / SAW760) TaxID=370354 RepID=B0ECJ7_ENTDS|nr:sodium transporter, putative [Entamoeba dispar SAW760]EDR27757.1 sodium transporter, putative [Entamoeba dispar SAW760]|eukprot:EDR27757.1 sodium transporter, putative [Entamoeba dispar SAW760]
MNNKKPEGKVVSEIGNTEPNKVSDENVTPVTSSFNKYPDKQESVEIEMDNRVNDSRSYDHSQNDNEGVVQQPRRWYSNNVSPSLRSGFSEQGQMGRENCQSEMAEGVNSEDSSETSIASVSNQISKRVRPAVVLNDGSKEDEEQGRSDDNFEDENEIKEDKSLPPHDLGYYVARLRTIIYPNFLNYYLMHFLFFTALCFVGAIIMILIDSKLNYIDALYTAVSSYTGSGLTVIDLTKVKFGIQFISYLLTFIGSIVLDSSYYILIKLFRMGTKKQTKSLEGTAPQVVIDAAIAQARHINSTETKTSILLLVVIWLYNIIVQVIGFLLLLIAFAKDKDKIEATGVNWVWFTLYQTNSAFNNCGIVLSSNSLVSFSNNAGVTIIVSILTVLGNTCYPIVLRGIIELLGIILKCTRYDKIIQYILRYPRRCSTHIYPRKATIWLIIVFFMITFSEFIIQMSLDFNNFKDIPVGYRTIDIFAQSISTRTAGFAILDFSKISSGCYVMMIGFMYLSSYPITVTLRETNPYLRHKENSNQDSGIVYQAKNMLAWDVVCFYSFYFLICCCEQDALRKDYTYTEFMILFEVISAYGTVGYSLPMTNGAYSVSGGFRPICKLFICCVMMFGKHRGFPERVDRGFTPYQIVINRKENEDSSLECQVNDRNEKKIRKEEKTKVQAENNKEGNTSTSVISALDTPLSLPQRNQVSSRNFDEITFRDNDL